MDAGDIRETTRIEFLVLADFAEVVNSKLYLMGGGWDRFAPPNYPAPMRWGIAVGVRVPWLESNIPHRISLTLRTEDGVELFKLDGNVETGRPPGSKGQSTLVQLAVNGQTELQGPGSFEVIAEIDGDSKRLAITAASTPV